jgi:hypothetical protein
MVMSDAPFLAATRASYDAVAAEYADMVSADLDTKPLDQDGGKVATDLHIDGNWLDGGGCTLNFAHKGGPTPMTGIYVTNNRFGRGSQYQCPILISTQTILSQNSGNVWDDTGAPIPKPQQHD